MVLSESEVRTLRRAVGLPLELPPDPEARVWRRGQAKVTLDEALDVIRRNPGQTNTYIAGELGVSQPYITMLKKKLRARGDDV